MSTAGKLALAALLLIGGILTAAFGAHALFKQGMDCIPGDHPR